LFGFIDDQVKSSFNGDRNAFIAPAALTVFVWVLIMNSMDFLPIDIMAKNLWLFWSSLLEECPYCGYKYDICSSFGCVVLNDIFRHQGPWP
jgi:hypothetical protein